jgi:hypothetical protein
MLPSEQSADRVVTQLPPPDEPLPPMVQLWALGLDEPAGPVGGDAVLDADGLPLEGAPLLSEDILPLPSSPGPPASIELPADDLSTLPAQARKIAASAPHTRGDLRSSTIHHRVRGTFDRVQTQMSRTRIVLLFAVLGCGRPSGNTTAAATASATPIAPAKGHAVPCGELACAQYTLATEAFADATVGNPLVLGIGEVHAPKGAAVPSAARRFTDDLLPTLAGHASDLLLELMMPPSGCVDASVEVRMEQKVVTSHQAETNQSEYVAMGERARALGIVPDLLRPDCGDIAAMRGANDGAIGGTLETIVRLTSRQAERLVMRDAQSDADRGKMVVIYGGALHNDLAPRPELARWSYGPEIDAFLHGRFISIDLVVPEFIGDDETWRSLPWWPYYDPERLGRKTTLFRIGQRSFVLIFARTTGK